MPNRTTKKKKSPVSRTVRVANGREKPTRPHRPNREELGGSMSSDPDVVSGRRDRDEIPHTGREGFGDGQELDHSTKRKRSN